MLLPKSMISSQNFITYGRLLSLISDKLGESENYKKTVVDAFLIELRNAISHVDYFIEEYQIIIKINGKQETFDFNSFTVIVNNVRAIMETILKFKQYAQNQNNII